MAPPESIIGKEPVVMPQETGRVWAVVMTLVVYPLLAAWTLVGILIFPVGFLIWKVATRWSSGRIMRCFVWIYGRGWMVLVSPFVRFRREGFRGEKIRGPAILVVNHLSFFDTYCMAILPFSDVTFAVRSWPFRMFWYAGFMRLAGYLDVESMNWEENLAASRRVLEKDGFLLFFPEGHRSRDGRLQRFYSGAFRLSRELDCPVIPLCLTGTDRLLPPGRLWLRPARITLRVLPPVKPTAFANHGEMRRLVGAQMRENIEMMRQAEHII
jgi:1-acyl-sn-glycerol-3-phosphate acyltransferase